MTRDTNGARIPMKVRMQSDGTWGRTVWSGRDHVTTVRRYYYRTREEARDGDISDDIGQHGRVR